NLLAYLGHVRTVFCEDILFQHWNVSEQAEDGNTYKPNPVIHAKDTIAFEELLGERRKVALALMERITAFRGQAARRYLEEKLSVAPNWAELRRPDFSRLYRNGIDLPTTRVTIGVVSADIQSPHAQICLDRIKKFTGNYDLVILDNNRGPNFNHSHEMNRLIADCQNDFLVLLDDDVFVEAGWLEGLLGSVDDAVGLITPLHRNREGQLSYAGVVLSPDMTGNHTHAFNIAHDVFP